MSDLREAAQQALEALEEYAPQHGHPDDLMAVLFALRAALAQQAEPVEPVTTLTAQRGALLEALRKIGQYTGEGPTYSTPWQDIVADLGQTARAAIKVVEGENT